MWQLFTAQSLYKKRARYIAILWTLLIFIACFIPGNEIPNIKVPLIDKWVHFILFGGFSFLWLLAKPRQDFFYLLFIFLTSSITGYLVEELQGLLSFLGRAKDIYDIYADTVGAALGVFLFYIFARIARSKTI